MRKKKFIAVLVMLALVATSLLGNAAVTQAATINYVEGKTNQNGRIIKIQGKTIYYQAQLSSSPERWGATKTAKITGKTKYYKAISWLKAKKASKKATFKHVKKRVGNYNFFKVKNKKVSIWVYNVENYVG